MNKGKNGSPLFFGYVNGQFSEENNTRGSTYSQLVEYMKKKKIINNGDDGTVEDRKLIIFNNMNTNSRFNYGATAADANTAAVVFFALVVSVLRAFMCSTNGTPTNQKNPPDHENRQILVSFQSFYSKIGP